MQSQISDEEEYETVIYHGPDQPFETVIYHGPDQPFETVDEPRNCTIKSIQPKVKLESKNVRSAQTSEQYGGLLTPDFFLRTPDTSSSSFRDVTSSEVVGSLHSPTVPITALDIQNKIPFHFSKVTDVSKEEKETYIPLTDDIVHKLERLEILDENPDEVDESHWEVWPKKFIEQKGYYLGIQPGDFYRNQALSCFYVKLPHRSNYEVVVTNKNKVACDLDLYVNGQLTNAIRLPAGVTRSIDGPAYAKYAFKIFRSNDAPPGKKVKERARQNGVIKAVFTPEKIGISRLRSASEPFRTKAGPIDFLDILKDPKEERKQRSFTTNDQDKVERSIVMSQVMEAVTLLQGKKKKKHYAKAPEMETDISKQVVLQLRLIASLVEEVEATGEEVYDLEPPPLPPRRE